MRLAPGSLRVRRHVAVCRVHDRAPSRRVELDLHAALAEHLGDCLAASSRPGIAPDGLVLIRRLEVGACVGVGWNARRTAEAIAAAVTHELDRTLRSGPDGDAVLWFPSRAAWLAGLLVDIVDGRAAGRWEYAEHDGRLGRPPSAALREVTAVERADALAAIRLLAPADRHRMLGTLTPSDAGEVLDLIIATGPDVRTSEALGPALAAFELALARAFPDDARVGALAIFLHLADRDGAAPSRAAASTSRALAHLGVALRSLAADDADRLGRAVTTGDWAGAADVAGATAVGALAEMTSWPPAARREAVRLVTGAPPSASSPPQTRDRDRSTTPLGGMFLLLPLLDELPFVEATTGWAPLVGTEAEALVGAADLARYLAVAAALGAPRNAIAAVDLVLRRATGIPTEVDGPSLRSWAAAQIDESVRGFAAHPGFHLRPRPQGLSASRLAADAAYVAPGAAFGLDDRIGGAIAIASRALLGELSGRLPGMARASFDYLWENVLDCRATVEVDLDVERFVVRLSNPPLHLLLSLSGANRRSFRLPATREREWILTQDG